MVDFTGRAPRRGGAGGLGPLGGGKSASFTPPAKKMGKKDLGEPEFGLRAHSTEWWRPAASPRASPRASRAGRVAQPAGQPDSGDGPARFPAWLASRLATWLAPWLARGLARGLAAGWTRRPGGRAAPRPCGRMARPAPAALSERLRAPDASIYGRLRPLAKRLTNRRRSVPPACGELQTMTKRRPMTG